ncbi:MAG TPA: hypothetical protein VFP34_09145 [Microlunatus sp.]|nr:hypothetical protein [Microlunatus sp.]
MGASHRRRLAVVLDLLRAQGEGEPARTRRRAARLDALIEHARSRTVFYRDRDSGLPPAHVRLGQLPPVTKPELMAQFDEAVSDPAVTQVRLEAFVAEPARVRRPFLDRYFVCATSSSSGRVRDRR